MPVEQTFKCNLSSGLHARPCSRIAEIARRYNSDATLVNRRNGRTANLKSVLSLISADVLFGDEFVLSFTGEDESTAAAAVRVYIDKDLLDEEAASLSTSQPIRKPLPRALRLARVKAAFGTPLSSGFGRGTVLFTDGIRLPPLGECGPAGELGAEQERISIAQSTVRHELDELTRDNSVGAAAGIVKAHIAILEDPAFSDFVARHLLEGIAAGDAIVRTAHFFAEVFSKSESDYIRQRAIDVQEVALRLYQEIYVDLFRHKPLCLDTDSILFAEYLGAQELLKLDRSHLKGLIFGDGQATSHAVILARSIGIPAIAGAAEAKRAFSKWEDVILDGSRGFVVSASSEAQRFYTRERECESLRREKLSPFAKFIGSTADGHRMEVGANISSVEEANFAFQNGCDGIGLFRTEMLFIGRDIPPAEAYQFNVYADTVKAANGKPVILRTFDVGGDKPAAYLNRPPEGQASLGDRGIFIYKLNRDVLQTQLCAMLRASAFGKLRIMVPLVSEIEEIHWMREQLELAKQKLTSRKEPFDPSVEFGIMIELPAIVPRLASIANEVDFFSIGTNDLAQYFFAEDRTKSRVDMLSQVRHPEFLRLLCGIAVQAKKSKKWLGMCGEMASDPKNLPLLIGLGLDEISINGGGVLDAKSRIAKLSTSACSQVLEKALESATVEDAQALLGIFVTETTMKLVDAELTLLASRSTSREDAICELVDVLCLHERSADPDRLEDALWEREATYSTDMGLGFALPHCKSDAVLQSSIAVLRPSKPFLWTSESTVPVRAVIMLAMKNETGKHMQVLSTLARKLMDEDFRERLLEANDIDETVRLLTHEAGIT